MSLIAIHQPNFLPWLGFFDKLAKADRFIILDSVALQLTGGNYTNRVRMLINGAPMWVTVPVTRGRAARARIDQATIAELPGWRKALCQTIKQSYSKAPFVAATMPIVENVVEGQTSLLCDMNLRGIFSIARALNIDTGKIVRSSELSCGGQSTELLVNLVKAVGGTAYLAGHGAGGYQDDGVFAQNDIAVLYQRYQTPPYPQQRVKEFVPGLSAIDALMNCGPRAANLIGASAVATVSCES